MSEVCNNTNLISAQAPTMKGNADFNTDAHYSDNLKVERPKIIASSGPVLIPKKSLFSDKDATKRMQKINTDIYEGAKKEKSAHEYNRKLYFKIFGGIVLTAAGVAGFSKIRKWFGGKK